MKQKQQLTQEITKYWAKYLNDCAQNDIVKYSYISERNHKASQSISIDQMLLNDFLTVNDIKPFVFFNALISTFMFRCFGLKEMTISYPKVLNHPESCETKTYVYPLKIKLPAGLKFSDLLQHIDQQYQQDCLYQQFLPKVIDTTGFTPNISVIDRSALNLNTPETQQSTSIMSFIYDLNRQSYNVVYDEAYIPNYFIDYLKMLISSILNDAHNDINQYTLISPAQTKKILYDWNQTDKPYPTDITIHELFQRQAQQTPNNIAAAYEDRELTYKELNQQSNQLARHIRKTYFQKTNKTLVADTLIGLCLDKSIEMIIAMIAILKAGGAYVPIDPAYPKDRMHHILEETQVKIVLTQSDLKAQLTKQFEKLSATPSLLALGNFCYSSESNSNLNIYSHSSSLAYVMYTSGTTGKPKGVMIEHRGIHSLLFDQKYVNLKESQNSLFLSNAAFDASTFEIYLSFLSGGKLFIPKYQRTLISSPYALEQAVNTNGIKTLWLTKTLFDYLYVNKPDIFKQLDTLIVGGEALNANLISELLNSNSAPKALINGYGPTESTTFATMFPCHKNIIENVPIGKPLVNRRTYVLDNQKNITPVGVVGELHIGGLGVARGYLTQLELTGKSFMVNPFSSEADIKKGAARLYKTGDLVRWLPDGNLEYIGRSDAQVKVRGFRIELDEIASRLTRIEEIKQSVVTVEPRRHKSQYKDVLIAYYVSHAPLSHRVLKESLSVKLPAYMLPQKFIHLDQFPLTSNGKLNIQALRQVNTDQNGKTSTALDAQYYKHKHSSVAYYA